MCSAGFAYALIFSSTQCQNVSCTQTPILLLPSLNRYFEHPPSRGKSLNAVLFDLWCQCEEGNWKKSEFYMNIKSRHVSKKRGVRKWLLRHEMDEKFTVKVAEALRAHKAADESLWKSETRYHPELPEQEDG